VREGVVVARDDRFGGKQLVAYVSPASAKASADPGEFGPALVAELRAFLGARLPAYMVPEVFVVLPGLPRLPNGKVDRRALPAASEIRISPTDAAAPPFTATEKILAAIWGEVLRVPSVSGADNFFALGGHSLLAVRVVARVRTAFQVELPMKHVFEAATLAALAARIEDQLFERIGDLSDDEARSAIGPGPRPATELRP
jgi:acyl carrier protein